MTRTHKIDNALPAEQKRVVYERHLSPAQVAELWGVSPDTVRRLFENEPGVLVIGNEGRARGKRGYRTLRIPQHVVERVHRRLTRV